jgi:hypothetical protein
MFAEGDCSYDEWWDYVLRTLCGCIIALPDGSLYSPIHGCTTGNPMVQPVETLINAAFTIADIALSENLTGDVYQRVWHVWVHYLGQGLGDDQITSHDGPFPFMVEDVARYESEYWGVLIRTDRCWMGRGDTLPVIEKFGQDPKAPFYLGSYLVEGVPWRSTAELLLKLLYPESAPITWCGELVRLASYRGLWWTNKVAVDFLDKLVDSIAPIAWSELDRFHDLQEVLGGWVTNTPRARYELPTLEYMSALQLLADPKCNWDGAYGDRSPPKNIKLENEKAIIFR